LNLKFKSVTAISCSSGINHFIAEIKCLLATILPVLPHFPRLYPRLKVTANFASLQGNLVYASIDIDRRREKKEKIPAFSERDFLLSQCLEEEDVSGI
jgi:hypothetical protein